MWMIFGREFQHQSSVHVDRSLLVILLIFVRRSYHNNKHSSSSCLAVSHARIYWRYAATDTQRAYRARNDPPRTYQEIAMHHLAPAYRWKWRHRFSIIALTSLAIDPLHVCGHCFEEEACETRQLADIHEASRRPTHLIELWQRIIVI